MTVKEMMQSKFYQKMDKFREEYSEKVRAHEEEREEIIKKYGWESLEMVEWKKERRQIEATNIYPNGMWRAMRILFQNYQRGREELEVNDGIGIWDEDVEAFVAAIAEMGCDTFVLTDSSSGLMREIHSFIKVGCEMVEATEIVEERNEWEGMKMVHIPGIRFRVKK